MFHNYIEGFEYHNRVIDLMKASEILDHTGTLYMVCEQAIAEGTGTAEQVRKIWEKVAAEAAAAPSDMIQLMDTAFMLQGAATSLRKIALRLARKEGP